jgi:hypothetical protein
MHAFSARTLGAGIIGKKPYTCTLTGCYSIMRSPDFKQCIPSSGDIASIATFVHSVDGTLVLRAILPFSLLSEVLWQI